MELGMKLSMELILDYIGVYAPMILFVISLLLLRNIHNYFKFLLIGITATNILNIILKLVIQQPRPLKDNLALEIAISNGQRISFHKYGMPSGHAQNCGFLLGYVSLVLKNITFTGIFLMVSLLSLIQRVKYNNHTIFQVFVGFFIGLFSSYYIYELGKQYIIGHLDAKSDDDAPI